MRPRLVVSAVLHATVVANGPPQTCQDFLCSSSDFIRSNENITCSDKGCTTAECCLVNCEAEDPCPGCRKREGVAKCKNGALVGMCYRSRCAADCDDVDIGIPSAKCSSKCPDGRQCISRNWKRMGVCKNENTCVVDGSRLKKVCPLGMTCKSKDFNETAICDSGNRCVIDCTDARYGQRSKKCPSCTPGLRCRSSDGGGLCVEDNICGARFEMSHLLGATEGMSLCPVDTPCALRQRRRSFYATRGEISSVSGLCTPSNICAIDCTDSGGAALLRVRPWRRCGRCVERAPCTVMNWGTAGVCTKHRHCVVNCSDVGLGSQSSCSLACPVHAPCIAKNWTSFGVCSKTGTCVVDCFDADQNGVSASCPVCPPSYPCETRNMTSPHICSSNNTCVVDCSRVKAGEPCTGCSFFSAPRFCQAQNFFDPGICTSDATCAVDCSGVDLGDVCDGCVSSPQGSPCKARNWDPTATCSLRNTCVVDCSKVPFGHHCPSCPQDTPCKARDFPFVGTCSPKSICVVDCSDAGFGGSSVNCPSCPENALCTTLNRTSLGMCSSQNTCVVDCSDVVFGHLSANCPRCPQDLPCKASNSSVRGVCNSNNVCVVDCSDVAFGDLGANCPRCPQDSPCKATSPSVRGTCNSNNACVVDCSDVAYGDVSARCPVCPQDSPCKVSNSSLPGVCNSNNACVIDCSDVAFGDLSANCLRCPQGLPCSADSPSLPGACSSDNTCVVDCSDVAFGYLSANCPLCSQDYPCKANESSIPGVCNSNNTCVVDCSDVGLGSASVMCPSCPEAAPCKAKEWSPTGVCNSNRTCVVDCSDIWLGGRSANCATCPEDTPCKAHNWSAPAMCDSNNTCVVDCSDVVFGVRSSNCPSCPEGAPCKSHNSPLSGMCDSENTCVSAGMAARYVAIAGGVAVSIVLCSLLCFLFILRPRSKSYQSESVASTPRGSLHRTATFSFFALDDDSLVTHEWTSVVDLESGLMTDPDNDECDVHRRSTGFSESGASRKFQQQQPSFNDGIDHALEDKGGDDSLIEVIHTFSDSRGADVYGNPENRMKAATVNIQIPFIRESKEDGGDDVPDWFYWDAGHCRQVGPCTTKQMHLCLKNEFFKGTHILVRKNCGPPNYFAPISEWYPASTPHVAPFTQEPDCVPSLVAVGNEGNVEGMAATESHDEHAASCKKEEGSEEDAKNLVHAEGDSLTLCASPLMPSSQTAKGGSDKCAGNNWFYLSPHHQAGDVGPFTLVELGTWHEWGEISLATQVRHQTMQQTTYIPFADVLSAVHKMVSKLTPTAPDGSSAPTGLSLWNLVSSFACDQRINRITDMVPRIATTDSNENEVSNDRDTADVKNSEAAVEGGDMACRWLATLNSAEGAEYPTGAAYTEESVNHLSTMTPAHRDDLSSSPPPTNLSRKEQLRLQFAQAFAIWEDTNVAVLPRACASVTAAASADTLPQVQVRHASLSLLDDMVKEDNFCASSQAAPGVLSTAQTRALVESFTRSAPSEWFYVDAETQKECGPVTFEQIEKWYHATTGIMGLTGVRQKDMEFTVVFEDVLKVKSAAMNVSYDAMSGIVGQQNAGGSGVVCDKAERASCMNEMFDVWYAQHVDIACVDTTRFVDDSGHGENTGLRKECASAEAKGEPCENIAGYGGSLLENTHASVACASSRGDQKDSAAASTCSHTPTTATNEPLGSSPFLIERMHAYLAKQFATWENSSAGHVTAPYNATTVLADRNTTSSTDLLSAVGGDSWTRELQCAASSQRESISRFRPSRNSFTAASLIENTPVRRRSASHLHTPQTTDGRRTKLDGVDDSSPSRLVRVSQMFTKGFHDSTACSTKEADKSVKAVDACGREERPWARRHSFSGLQAESSAAQSRVPGVDDTPLCGPSRMSYHFGEWCDDNTLVDVKGVMPVKLRGVEKHKTKDRTFRDKKKLSSPQDAHTTCADTGTSATLSAATPDDDDADIPVQSREHGTGRVHMHRTSRPSANFDEWYGADYVYVDGAGPAHVDQLIDPPCNEADETLKSTLRDGTEKFPVKRSEQACSETGASTTLFGTTEANHETVPVQQDSRGASPQQPCRASSGSQTFNEWFGDNSHLLHHTDAANIAPLIGSRSSNTWRRNSKCLSSRASSWCASENSREDTMPSPPACARLSATTPQTPTAQVTGVTRPHIRAQTSTNRHAGTEGEGDEESDALPLPCAHTGTSVVTATPPVLPITDTAHAHKLGRTAKHELASTGESFGAIDWFFLDTVRQVEVGPLSLQQMHLCFTNAFFNCDTTLVRKGDATSATPFAPISKWYPDEGTPAAAPFTHEPQCTLPRVALDDNVVQNVRLAKVASLPSESNPAAPRPSSSALCTETRTLQESFCTAAVDWFYFDSTHSCNVGPFSFDQMEKWFQWGQITKETGVRKQGMSKYIEFSEVCKTQGTLCEPGTTASVDGDAPLPRHPKAALARARPSSIRGSPRAQGVNLKCDESSLIDSTDAYKKILVPCGSDAHDGRARRHTVPDTRPEVAPSKVSAANVGTHLGQANLLLTKTTTGQPPMVISERASVKGAAKPRRRTVATPASRTENVPHGTSQMQLTATRELALTGESLCATDWFFLDTVRDKEVGPFSLEQMRLWFSHSVFDRDSTHVRKGDGATHSFGPIAEWYPDDASSVVEPFTQEPTCVSPYVPQCAAVRHDRVHDSQRDATVSCEDNDGAGPLPSTQNSIAAQTGALSESFHNDSVDWFYFDSSSAREVGPLTLEQMESWFQWDQISETTDVRQHSMVTYITLKEVLDRYNSSRRTHAEPASTFTATATDGTFANTAADSTMASMPSMSTLNAPSRLTLATTTSCTSTVDAVLPHGFQYFTDMPKHGAAFLRIPPGKPDNWLWTYVDDSNPSKSAVQGPWSTTDMLDRYTNGLLGTGDAFKDLLVKTDFMVSWAPAGEIFSDLDLAFQSEPTRRMFLSWWRQSTQRIRDRHAMCGNETNSSRIAAITTRNAHDERRAARRHLRRKRDENVRKRFHINLDATTAPRRKRQYDATRRATFSRLNARPNLNSKPTFSRLRGTTIAPLRSDAHSRNPRRKPTALNHPSSSITTHSRSAMRGTNAMVPTLRSASVETCAAPLPQPREHGDETRGRPAPAMRAQSREHASAIARRARHGSTGVLPSTAGHSTRSGARHLHPVPASRDASFQSSSSSNARGLRGSAAPLLPLGSIYGAPSSSAVSEPTSSTLFISRLRSLRSVADRVSDARPGNSTDRGNVAARVNIHARHGTSTDRGRTCRAGNRAAPRRSLMSSSPLSAKLQDEKKESSGVQRERSSAATRRDAVTRLRRVPMLAPAPRCSAAVPATHNTDAPSTPEQHE